MVKSSATLFSSPGQRKSRLELGAGGNGSDCASRVLESRGRRVLRQMRAGRRLTAGILWTALCCPIQAVLLSLPGRAKVVFARLYWAGFCRCIGLSIRLVGLPAIRNGRRVVFAANHSSWLDIPVLGARLEACFVSKEEIAHWPGISLVARLGRTVFVSRTRGATLRERDDMQRRLGEGDNLLLFPEGTSADGSRVLPFRSAFFSIVAQESVQGSEMPLVQPVSIVYDQLAGLPTGRGTRALFAWYGDMDLVSHFWRLAQHRSMRVTVVMHPALDPAEFSTRKALAQAAWQDVAAGAAAMRQNRSYGFVQADRETLKLDTNRSLARIRPPELGGTGCST